MNRLKRIVWVFSLAGVCSACAPINITHAPYGLRRVSAADRLMTYDYWGGYRSAALRDVTGFSGRNYAPVNRRKGLCHGN